MGGDKDVYKFTITNNTCIFCICSTYILCIKIYRKIAYTDNRKNIIRIITCVCIRFNTGDKLYI